MIHRFRADAVRLDADENGWELHVDTDEGDQLVVNIHATAFDFARSIGLAELCGQVQEAMRGV